MIDAGRSILRLVPIAGADRFEGTELSSLEAGAKQFRHHADDFRIRMRRQATDDRSRGTLAEPLLLHGLVRADLDRAIRELWITWIGARVRAQVSPRVLGQAASAYCH